MQLFKQNSPSSSSRSQSLDVLRGATVMLMIIFHFSYDLNSFGIIDVDIIHHPFWYAFPRAIVFLFLFATGMSLKIAHSSHIKWRAFTKRLGLIAFWALVVSATTYYLYPDKWIYFGTLHAIAVISLFTLPFLNSPRWALAIALALFIPSIFFDWNLPWIKFDHSSLDYIAPFPWWGASLLGIVAADKKLHLAPVPSFFPAPLIKSLNYLGQHSLFIYLVHQPLLFGLLTIVVKVIRS